MYFRICAPCWGRRISASFERECSSAVSRAAHGCRHALKHSDGSSEGVDHSPWIAVESASTMPWRPRRPAGWRRRAALQLPARNLISSKQHTGPFAVQHDVACKYRLLLTRNSHAIFQGETPCCSNARGQLRNRRNVLRFLCRKRNAIPPSKHSGKLPAERASWLPMIIAGYLIGWSENPAGSAIWKPALSHRPFPIQASDIRI